MLESYTTESGLMESGREHAENYTWNGIAGKIIMTHGTIDYHNNTQSGENLFIDKLKYKHTYVRSRKS